MAEPIRDKSAIILAAGYSSRMHDFKPLLPLNGQPILEHIVRLFFSVGIHDIRIVVGHRRNDIQTRLNHYPVHWVFNPHYEDGMFTSVLAGVKSLSERHRSFFLMPGDMPMVRAATLFELLEAHRRKVAAIMFPRFKGRRGHPPLIDTCHVPGILKWPGDEGLYGYLKQQAAVDVEVADEGILLDANTPEAYQRLVHRSKRQDMPTWLLSKRGDDSKRGPGFG